MTRAIRLFFFLLSCHAALGTTVIPTDYIQLTPTNAAGHDVSFSYGQTNEYVTVILPYTKDELSFDGAFLECTNAARHLYVPVKGIHPSVVQGEKDVILISFRMDRELVRECTLKVYFTKGITKGIMYVLTLADFVSRVEPSPQK